MQECKKWSEPLGFVSYSKLTRQKRSRQLANRLLLLRAPFATPFNRPVSGVKEVTRRSDSPNSFTLMIMALEMCVSMVPQPDTQCLEGPSAQSKGPTRRQGLFATTLAGYTQARKPQQMQTNHWQTPLPWLHPALPPLVRLHLLKRFPATPLGNTHVKLFYVRVVS